MGLPWRISKASVGAECSCPGMTHVTSLLHEPPWVMVFFWAQFKVWLITLKANMIWGSCYPHHISPSFPFGQAGKVLQISSAEEFGRIGRGLSLPLPPPWGISPPRGEVGTLSPGLSRVWRLGPANSHGAHKVACNPGGGWHLKALLLPFILTLSLPIYFYWCTCTFKWFLCF